MAQQSGKLYLDVETQEDAEEFLTALEEVLSEELITSQEFNSIRSEHWGREEMKRKFLDNTQAGTCRACGLCPLSNEVPFLLVKLTIPKASTVTLSSLIDNHYSERTQATKIKCSNCCPHDDQNVQCSQTGVCRPRQASELCQLTKAPKFLFIQLLRYDNNGEKVTTFVKLGAELILPNEENGVKYELLGMLNHIGHTRKSGHYVTYLKLQSDKWMKFDDDFTQSKPTMPIIIYFY